MDWEKCLQEAQYILYVMPYYLARVKAYLGMLKGLATAFPRVSAVFIPSLKGQGESLIFFKPFKGEEPNINPLKTSSPPISKAIGDVSSFIQHYQLRNACVVLLGKDPEKDKEILLANDADKGITIVEFYYSHNRFTLDQEGTQVVKLPTKPSLCRHSAFKVSWSIENPKDADDEASTEDLFFDTKSHSCNKLDLRLSITLSGITLRTEKEVTIQVGINSDDYVQKEYHPALKNGKEISFVYNLELTNKGKQKHLPSSYIPISLSWSEYRIQESVPLPMEFFSRLWRNIRTDIGITLLNDPTREYSALQKYVAAMTNFLGYPDATKGKEFSKHQSFKVEKYGVNCTLHSFPTGSVAVLKKFQHVIALVYPKDLGTSKDDLEILFNNCCLYVVVLPAEGGAQKNAVAEFQNAGYFACEGLPSNDGSFIEILDKIAPNQETSTKAHQISVDNEQKLGICLKSLVDEKWMSLKTYPFNERISKISSDSSKLFKGVTYYKSGIKAPLEQTKSLEDYFPDLLPSQLPATLYKESPFVCLSGPFDSGSNKFACPTINAEFHEPFLQDPEHTRETILKLFSTLGFSYDEFENLDSFLLASNMQITEVNEKERFANYIVKKQGELVVLCTEDKMYGPFIWENKGKGSLSELNAFIEKNLKPNFKFDFRKQCSSNSKKITSTEEKFYNAANEKTSALKIATKKNGIYFFAIKISKK